MREMAGKEVEERQLVDDGNQLLNPPFAIDELLCLLQRVEASLSKVNQSPCESVAVALLPLRSALVSDNLLRHSDTDVKVSVAFCLTQLLRITAPDSPYDDELMKEIFHLLVAVFQKLSHTSSSCYPKVVGVLVTIETIRATVMLLDLDWHALVIEMFQLFLKTIRSNKSDVVFAAMAAIMTLAIMESDDISMEILAPLLASVKKENQSVSSRMLGKEVIQNCAAKIEPFLLKAVNSVGLPLDNYDQIIGSICQSAANSFKCYDLYCHEEPLGKSADVLTYGSSAKNYMKQLASWLEQSETGLSCQKRTQDLFPQTQTPPSADAFLASIKEEDLCSELTMVNGYEVKARTAPMLRAMFAKYGDIAANCQYKSVSVRASLLELACDIIRRLQTTDNPLTLSDIKVIRNEVKDLEATNIKISWLSQPLAKISQVEKIAQMRSTLKSVKANSILVVKAATKELEDALMDLVALQKRMGEAERRINAMKLVVQKIDEAIKEAEAEELLWQKQIGELL